LLQIEVADGGHQSKGGRNDIRVGKGESCEAKRADRMAFADRRM